MLHKNTQDEIFAIQATQLMDEIKKIEFIAENKDEIIKNLFTEVAEKNAEYFKTKIRRPHSIFRGNDFGQYVDKYYRNQTKEN